MKNQKKYQLKNFNEQTKFIFCPFENTTDKVGSFEVNLTTGEYYCHNCHIHGNIEALDDETQEVIEFSERVGEQYE